MSSSVKVIAAVVGLFAATGLAWGADLPPPLAPVPYKAAYSWTGLYIGLNAGYASAKVTNTVAGGRLDGTGSTSITGGIGGAQLGANYQIGPMVLGFEADFDGNVATKSITVAGATTGTDQIPWIGTLRGRVGYAFDRLMVYATAGGAATELLSNLNVGAVGSSGTTNTHGAWTAGAGIEAAMMSIGSPGIRSMRP